MGLYDADQGNVFSLKKGQTIKSPISNLPIKGQVRRIKPIKISGKTHYLVIKNNDKMMVLSHHSNVKL